MSSSLQSSNVLGTEIFKKKKKKGSVPDLEILHFKGTSGPYQCPFTGKDFMLEKGSPSEG